MLNVKEINATSATFPKLMIACNGKVVLFNSKASGMIVRNATNTLSLSEHVVGYYTDCWAPEDFVDYLGEISLSNNAERE
jgi:hypothetical protein